MRLQIYLDGALVAQSKLATGETAGAVFQASHACGSADITLDESLIWDRTRQEWIPGSAGYTPWMKTWGALNIAVNQDYSLVKYNVDFSGVDESGGDAVPADESRMVRKCGPYSLTNEHVGNPWEVYDWWRPYYNPGEPVPMLRYTFKIDIYFHSATHKILRDAVTGRIIRTADKRFVRDD